MALVVSRVCCIPSSFQLSSLLLLCSRSAHRYWTAVALPGVPRYCTCLPSVFWWVGGTVIAMPLVMRGTYVREQLEIGCGGTPFLLYEECTCTYHYCGPINRGPIRSIYSIGTRARWAGPARRMRIVCLRISCPPPFTARMRARGSRSQALALALVFSAVRSPSLLSHEDDNYATRHKVRSDLTVYRAMLRNHKGRDHGVLEEPLPVPSFATRPSPFVEETVAVPILWRTRHARPGLEIYAVLLSWLQ